MEGVTVDQVDAVVEESFFEKESSSKSSWKFCNQTTLPRSEVVFFVQMFVILLLISLCIVKLTILKPNCEETSVWISILSSFSWIHFTKSQTMNKIISTQDRVFMAVVGPSGCGKTELIFKMLRENTFYPKFNNIIFFTEKCNKYTSKWRKHLVLRLKSTPI